MTEVDEQAQFHFGRAQIIVNLRAMFVRQSRDRFQLDYNLVLVPAAQREQGQRTDAQQCKS